jgi:signal transduction histidine kinase
MQPSLWIALGILAAGAGLSWWLIGRSFRVSCWMLCLSTALAILILFYDQKNPLLVIGSFVPILFAILLLDRKQMVIFTSIVILANFWVDTAVLQLPLLSPALWGPILFVISLAIFIQLIVSDLSSSFVWYQQKYLSAIKNEQIIRDNEVKLERLLNNLNDYQKYLREANILLIGARDEAEKARNVKQIFVQNVSHELRTPLNLIIGFSETMVNAPDSYRSVNWTPDLRGDIECIYQNSQHLKALIDDVLDMAALENKKYEIVTAGMDLNAIVQEIVLISVASYKNKGLSLKADLGKTIPLIQADSTRVKQVILNLLSNALKYTKKGGVVVSTRKEDGNAVVSVKDTGIGIPPEDIERVFEAFYQVDKTSNREDSGTGLGLSISKQLIELHGGSMRIQSVLGTGTTVIFTLPLS